MQASEEKVVKQDLVFFSQLIKCKAVELSLRPGGYFREFFGGWGVGREDKSRLDHGTLSLDQTSAEFCYHIRDVPSMNPFLLF